MAKKSGSVGIEKKAGLSGDDGKPTALSTIEQNEQGDGLVISSIYSRGLVGIYGKPIQKGASLYELTDEEREAITTAIRESKKQ